MGNQTKWSKADFPVRQQESARSEYQEVKSRRQTVDQNTSQRSRAKLGEHDSTSSQGNRRHMIQSQAE